MDTAFCESLSAVFRRVFASQQAILAGLSGGLDSVVLLHALRQWQTAERPALRLRAIYIHHGLNPLADDWAEHCRTFCDSLSVPFQVCRVQVDPRKKGIEAAARDARYQAFREVIAPDEALVTAQHLDDQSETFFLALKRGSGPAGLSAMPEQMAFGANPLIRPLLSFSRAQLEQYAQYYQLSWVEDDSNQDRRYDRNFLRHAVLPQLNARWPHFAQAVSRSAALCGEQEALLDELLLPELMQLTDADNGLSFIPLLSAGTAKRNGILRRWLKHCGVQMPSQHQLALLWQEVALAKPDAEPGYCLKPVTIRRYQNKLYVTEKTAGLSACCLPWELSSVLQLPDDAGVLRVAETVTSPDSVSVVRPPRPDEQVTVRFGLQGHYHICGRDRGRSAKKLWQECGVAPWLRERTPLLWYNDTLIAAVGVFVTKEGEADEAKLMIMQEKNNPADGVAELFRTVSDQ